MSDVSTIKAELRTEFGKGGARRTRRAGLVPAVLYEHGDTPTHLALPAREFAAALRYGGMTQVLTVKLPDGAQVLALPKAVQRDPIKNTHVHADLLVVRRGERVTVEVPVQLVGEPAKGTLVITEIDRISVNADATQLPDFVEASLDGLDVGAHITASDVRLPAGAELASEPDTLLVTINVAPTAEQMGEPEAAAEEAPETAAETA